MVFGYTHQGMYYSRVWIGKCGIGEMLRFVRRCGGQCLRIVADDCVGMGLYCGNSIRFGIEFWICVERGVEGGW